MAAPRGISATSLLKIVDQSVVPSDLVCADYSITKDGVLTAYRFKPDDVRAESSRFSWV